MIKTKEFRIGDFKIEVYYGHARARRQIRGATQYKRVKEVRAKVRFRPTAKWYDREILSDTICPPDETIIGYSLREVFGKIRVHIAESLDPEFARVNRKITEALKPDTWVWNEVQGLQGLHASKIIIDEAVIWDDTIDPISTTIHSDIGTITSHKKGP